MSSKTIKLVFFIWLNSLDNLGQNKYLKILPEASKQLSQKTAESLSPFSLLLSSVQVSHSVMSDSLQPHESQHARPPCPSPTPGVYPNPCTSSQWCHPAISFSVVPFFSCPQSLPESESFPMSPLFTWGGQVLEFQLQHHSFERNPRADLLQNGLVGSPCSPRNSQQSSPTPQFKSINSSALSFLHSPTLTSRHDHWKNHSLDHTQNCMNFIFCSSLSMPVLSNMVATSH